MKTISSAWRNVGEVSAKAAGPTQTQAGLWVRKLAVESGNLNPTQPTIPSHAGGNPAALTKFHQRAVFAPPLTSALGANSVPREAGGFTFTDPVPAESRDTLDAGSVSFAAAGNLRPALPTGLRTPRTEESPALVRAAIAMVARRASLFVAVIEGLGKLGNAGVRLTGAMTLSAPAFAIR